MLIPIPSLPRRRYVGCREGGEAHQKYVVSTLPNVLCGKRRYELCNVTTSNCRPKECQFVKSPFRRSTATPSHLQSSRLMRLTCKQFLASSYMVQSRIVSHARAFAIINQPSMHGRCSSKGEFCLDDSSKWDRISLVQLRIRLPIKFSI